MTTPHKTRTLTLPAEKRDRREEREDRQTDPSQPSVSYKISIAPLLRAL